MSEVTLIGLIADTHGLLRAEVHEALAGVSLILHAGDVCGDDVLTELETIAPVFAVAGNCDPAGHPKLPAAVSRTVDGRRIHVSHGHELGVPSPQRLLDAYDAEIIVYGHTHLPLVHREGSRIVVNPGAAGPRRFALQPSVARMTITPTRVNVEFVSLAMTGQHPGIDEPA